LIKNLEEITMSKEEFWKTTAQRAMGHGSTAPIRNDALTSSELTQLMSDPMNILLRENVRDDIKTVIWGALRAFPQLDKTINVSLDESFTYQVTD